MLISRGDKNLETLMSSAQPFPQTPIYFSSSASMQLKTLIPAALLLACGAIAAPLPQDDYQGVTKTPDLQGLNAVLAEVQGGLEKLTQALHGKARRDEINLQDTPLSSIPELIPLLTTLGIPAGNH
ncbi:unnamed protein product [Sympodiomycopsis kandeliae]